MRIVYRLLNFLGVSKRPEVAESKEKNFFDYSSNEKIKLMRAAGRAAQKEQQQLLKTYNTHFNQVN